MGKAALVLFGVVLLAVSVAAMSLGLYWGAEQWMQRQQEADRMNGLLSPADHR